MQQNRLGLFLDYFPHKIGANEIASIFKNYLMNVELFGNFCSNGIIKNSLFDSFAMIFEIQLQKPTDEFKQF